MVSVAGAAISSLGVHHTERHFSLLPLALLLRSVAPAHTIPKRPLLSLSLSLCSRCCLRGASPAGTAAPPDCSLATALQGHGGHGVCEVCGVRGGGRAVAHTHRVRFDVSFRAAVTHIDTAAVTLTTQTHEQQH